MKRSDLSTTAVLAAVDQLGFQAFEALTLDYPAKLVQAAFTRDVQRGLLEYGVALECPWLTEAGRRQMTAGAER